MLYQWLVGISLENLSHCCIAILASFAVAEGAEDVASIFLPPSAQNIAREQEGEMRRDLTQCNTLSPYSHLTLQSALFLPSYPVHLSTCSCPKDRWSRKSKKKSRVSKTRMCFGIKTTTVLRENTDVPFSEWPNTDFPFLNLSNKFLYFILTSIYWNNLVYFLCRY